LLPVFADHSPVKPDLPALTDVGVPAAYFSYPASPPKLYTSPPLSNATISVLKEGDLGLPATLGKNPWWQQLNTRIGADMKITQIQEEDYQPKLTTSIAGGDLSDLTQMFPNWPHLPDVLKAKFQDLSPWLSGDSITKYPNLAAIPTSAWRNVALAGGLWGVPWPFGLPGSTLRARQDIVDKLGVSIDISNGQEYIKMCKELTDPKQHRWALNLISGTLTDVSEMVGAPNAWRVEDGKFTRSFETDEFTQALGIVQSLWKSGYIYPDSIGSTNAYEQWFISGSTVLLRDAYTNWAGIANRAASVPGFKQAGVVLPKWDGGGQAAHYENSGMYTFTALKKADDQRIEQILTALNWFASPFGSDEFLFLRYGIPTRDYTLKGSDPIETTIGTNECQAMEISYLATGPGPIYIAGQPQLTKDLYGYLKQLMQVTVPLPTVGLFSDSQLTSGAVIDKNANSAATDIIVGRKPLSSWANAVKAWQNGGGETIRKEYESAYASAH
jgi:putative aldouronate transport system substrate-binding protein